VRRSLRGVTFRLRRQGADRPRRQTGAQAVCQRGCGGSSAQRRSSSRSGVFRQSVRFARQAEAQAAPPKPRQTPPAVSRPLPSCARSVTAAASSTGAARTSGRSAPSSSVEKREGRSHRLEDALLGHAGAQPRTIVIAPGRICRPTGHALHARVARGERLADGSYVVAGRYRGSLHAWTLGPANSGGAARASTAADRPRFRTHSRRAGFSVLVSQEESDDRYELRFGRIDGQKAALPAIWRGRRSRARIDGGADGRTRQQPALALVSRGQAPGGRARDRAVNAQLASMGGPYTVTRADQTAYESVCSGSRAASYRGLLAQFGRRTGAGQRNIDLRSEAVARATGARRRRRISLPSACRRGLGPPRRSLLFATAARVPSEASNPRACREIFVSQSTTKRASFFSTTT
jgi:hypothetical protein